VTTPSKKHPDLIRPARPSFLDRPVDRGIVKNMLDFVEVMTLEDVETVVAMHESEIPGGVLTELGPAFLVLFYQQVIKDPNARGYVVRKNNTVVGFIAGSSDPDTFFKVLFGRNWFRLGFILLKRSLVRPVFLLRFTQRVRANLRKENLAESLSAAVAEGYKKSGFGLILLKKLLDEFRQSGIKRVQCDVAIDTDDPGIVTLHHMYQKCGYVQSDTFRVGGVAYKRYQRDLI